MKRPSESSLYKQLSPTDRRWREARFALAHRLDQQFLQKWQAEQTRLDALRQNLRILVDSYQHQHKKALEIRLHARRCRRGCAACPHHQITLYQDQKPLQIPLQTVSLRAHGIRKLASPLVGTQKLLTERENRIKTLSKALDQFTEKALRLLLDMDETLAEMAYPDYPTPFLTPAPQGPYSPLPYTLIAIFSTWIDNALYALAFSITRYAMENVKTKHGTAKQGFFGLHERPRYNALLPLSFSWRLYLRGKHGVWFGSDKALYRYPQSDGSGKKSIPVKITPRFTARSGNASYYLDIVKFRKMFSACAAYQKSYLDFTNALIAQITSLSMCHQSHMASPYYELDVEAKNVRHRYE